MHAFVPPLYSPFAASVFVPLFLVLIVWTIVLKGYALWFSARASQKWWFIALLIFNTLGILEIIYLIWFRPKSRSVSSATSMQSSSSTS